MANIHEKEYQLKSGCSVLFENELHVFGVHTWTPYDVNPTRIDWSDVSSNNEIISNPYWQSFGACLWRFSGYFLQRNVN